MLYFVVSALAEKRMLNTFNKQYALLFAGSLLLKNFTLMALMFNRRFFLGWVLVLCAAQGQAADLMDAVSGMATLARGAGRSAESATMAPVGPQIEVAFSPGEGAEGLVLRLIESSRQSLRLAAYSFTSAAVVGALQAAKRRGVDVAVVVDYRSMHDDRSGKARAALNILKNAGIATRTIARYPIHHDKLMVVDCQHVETGSFNYSQAATRNSENVIVLWNHEKVAQTYLKHWQSRYDQGDEYESTY